MAEAECVSPHAGLHPHEEAALPGHPAVTTKGGSDHAAVTETDMLSLLSLVVALLVAGLCWFMLSKRRRAKPKIN